MSKQFWFALALVAIVLGSIVAISNHNKPALTIARGTPTNHTLGTSPENITLVEYGDYQCPVCGTFYNSVKEVSSNYNSRVVFQFRNLPLTTLHANAFAAARAAEAAGMQGKYWEMHDILYGNQNGWSQSTNPITVFDTYARSIGLNITKFDDDYASESVNNAINADIDAFVKTGDEQATPTFYLDGKKLNNGDLIDANRQPSASQFAKLLDAELAKKATTAKP